MSDIAISVEGLSKSYLIGHQAGTHKSASLRDAVAKNTRMAIRKTRDVLRGRPLVQGDEVEEFWALKEVTFHVSQGARVGVIGRNGAGKSTLLKVLSRITEPTSGRVRIAGRVASLLEVGTGFHPELTGRENIFLNGAILGMTRREIQRNFDAIVGFAEVERFLDTPVKRYSSGMYVRLAFSVAAHLEPEVLIVDEVLAVGDAAFQKRCLGKMEEVSQHGRTVLFVSHNMAAVRALCDYGVVMERGVACFQGPIEEAVAYYNNGDHQNDSLEYAGSSSSRAPHVRHVHIMQDGVPRGSHLRIDRAITIDIESDVDGNTSVFLTLVVRNAEGQVIHHTTDEFADTGLARAGGRRRCLLPAHALAAGEYFLTVALSTRQGELFEKLTDVLKFTVEFAGRTADTVPTSTWRGLCGPGLIAWQ